MMNKSLKVLMLEDSVTDAELVRREVNKGPWECEFALAMNRTQFLEQLEQFRPDIILADNALPQFNASQALKIVQEQAPGTPFILVTGTVSEEFAARIIKSGADDYILKNSLIRLTVAMEAAIKFRIAEQEKKKASDQLRDSEEKYRTMMERVSDGFVSIDKNWNYTYVNNQAGEIMRANPESLIGKNIWDVFPESRGNAFYRAYHEALDKQEYVYLEEYYEALDSWLENHIYPSPDGLSIFFRDSTARKKAAQQLVESEANLKAIFNSASEGFILLDEKAMIRLFNERAQQIIRLDQQKTLEKGTSIYDYVESDRVTFIRSAIESALRKEAVQYDRSYPGNNGRFRWVNVNFTPVLYGEQLDGVCITVRDITERKVAEQRREFDHNNLHALINNTNDLLWSVDRNMNLITSNHAFNIITKLLSGVEPANGRSILEVSSSQVQHDRYREYYQRAFDGEIFTIVEYTPNPIEYWSEISFYPIREGNQVIGTACFARDITERKRSEEDLQKSNERFQLAIRATSDMLWEINFVSKTYAVHEGDERLAQIYRNVTWQNGVDASYIVEDDRDRIRDSFRAARYHPSNEFWREEYRVYTVDGEILQIVNQAIFIRDTNGKAIRAVGAISDITEKRKLEQELIEQREAEQLRTTGAILQAQQEERKAIGIELHDNVNQILVGTNLLLSMAQQKAGDGADTIGIAMQNLQEAIRENRKIAHELVGPEFDVHELTDQLQNLLNTMLEPAGIVTSLNTSEFNEELLNEEQKLALYRVAQEQCTNIIKHAKATAVEFILITSHEKCLMKIADDGIGISPTDVSKGIGLRNIRSRISIYNGEAQIVSAPGQGFELHVSLSLES